MHLLPATFDQMNTDRDLGRARIAGKERLGRCMAVVLIFISLQAADAIAGAPREQQQDQNDLCRLVLAIAEASRPYFSGCAGKDEADGRTLFSFMQVSSQMYKGGEAGSLDPVFDRKSTCSNEHYQYMHPENASPNKEKGLKILLRKNDAGFAFSFATGSLNGVTAPCGVCSGQAAKFGDAWELNGRKIECSKRSESSMRKTGADSNDRASSIGVLVGAFCTFVLSLFVLFSKSVNIFFRDRLLYKDVSLDFWRIALGIMGLIVSSCGLVLGITKWL